MKLDDNTVLITGGGTGIGLAMAKAFLERGNRVIICGRRREKLDEACDAAPGLTAYACDVSDEAGRRQLFESIRGDGLTVNVLINNAANMRVFDLTDPAKLDLDEAWADIRTNFFAPVALINLFLPTLRRQPNATIINVSSPGGVVPVTRVPFYCASKAALDSYTASLRHQLGEEIKVIELYPPSVDTAMMGPVEIRKISVDAFIGETMKRLARGADETWIGEGRYIPFLKRIAPKWTFGLVNRSTKIAE